MDSTKLFQHKLFERAIPEDYNDLINKPTINGVVVEGDKTAVDYLLQPLGNYAHLDENGKILVSELPDEVLGNLSYEGTWDASLNEPELPEIPESIGEYWIVSESGEQFGLEFHKGDWIIAGPDGWQKIDNTDLVTSVNGMTGDVVLQLDASSITYTHPDYPTVQAALDKLLYLAPSITSLTGGGTYENGKEISSVTLKWALNKAVTSQSFNQGIGSLDVNLRQYVYTPTNPIKSNTTFTLTVGDGTKTATKSTAVSFQNKIYWGVSPNTVLTNEEILAFEKAGQASFATSRTISKTFNCSGGNYFYFVMPTSFIASTMKVIVGGLSFSDYTLTAMPEFVNGSGKNVSYTQFRPNNLQNGSSITVEIK
jgi:hypothetical protein